MTPQYKGLGETFVQVATELALIFADCPSEAITAWFLAGMEQQDLSLNRSLRQLPIPATEQELRACYKAGYVSMIISLNYMPPIETRRQRADYFSRLCRPDLHCMALLLRQEDAVKPTWWDGDFVSARLASEAVGLEGSQWKQPAAWLLGLPCFPPDPEFRQWLFLQDDIAAEVF
jgi:hypothetical protein